MDICHYAIGSDVGVHVGDCGLDEGTATHGDTSATEQSPCPKSGALLRNACESWVLRFQDVGLG